MLTNAERKKKYRKSMTDKGLVRFECYLPKATIDKIRSEEHTSELQSLV